MQEQSVKYQSQSPPIMVTLMGRTLNREHWNISRSPRSLHYRPQQRKVHGLFKPKYIHYFDVIIMKENIINAQKDFENIRKHV